MPALLDSFPYPFADPAAQELHLILCQLHSTGQAAVSVMQKAGLESWEVNAAQTAYLVWGDILGLASNHGKLRSLVQTVYDRLSATSPARGFLGQLLQDQTPLVAEPRGADGAPKFLAKSDEVFEQEALLYHDDLTLQIGRVPGLIATLQRLAALAPSICKFTVDFNGRTMFGTGFRIGTDQLLTNWHVLHHPSTGKQATQVTAEFGYEEDAQGTPTNGPVIACDPATIHTSREDDWAVIQTMKPLDPAWEILPLDGAASFKEGDPTYIIQHPGGTRKRLGFVRNQVAFFDDRVVHYLTDTQSGSSGSPVLDAAGRLIALHHAGGRPQEVAGKPPVSKNEGIRISRVAAGLHSAGVKIT